MEEIDNQTAVETDNQSNLTQEPTENLTQSTDGSENVPQRTLPDQKPYQPFSNGKEKFKVNGAEEEWDWETAKKYASLGKTAYQKMEEAADLKKRTDTAYKQLLQLAKDDPETLIKALNPNYAGQPARQGANPSQPQARDVTEQDPRDLELRKTQEEVQRLSSFIENQQIETERLAIQREMDEAVNKYSTLKGNKFALNYVKSEYAKALRAGHDVSIDDVAFLVSQEIQAEQKQKTQVIQTKIAENRKKAPVSVAASSAESGAKPMTLDEVKRLAGRV